MMVYTQKEIRDMRIKWLHLSDIHFNYKNYDSATLREDFVVRVQDLSKGEPFTHLFLTGDILHRNQDPSVETVVFINNLIEVMQIRPCHVFIVPGNHDHDRDLTLRFTDSIYKIMDDKAIVDAFDSISSEDVALLLSSFKKFEDVYTNILGHPYYTKNTSPHRIVTDGNLNILQLNSAWLDTASSENLSLCYGSYILQQLLSEKESLFTSGVNIAIGHHPLEDFSPLERHRLLNMLERHGFGLYFCGHRHTPSIKKYDGTNIIQLTCPGGYNDDYSEGGYIFGILDTDCDFYKIEVFSWNDGDWSIESKLQGTDENGALYLNTKHFTHNSKIVAVDLKLFGGHVAAKQLAQTIGCENYKKIEYNLPSPIEWHSIGTSIENLSHEIESLIERNYVVHLFPLAQIPLLLKLGFELQNNSKMIIHQYDREHDIWVYGNDDKESDLNIKKTLIGAEILAVAISTSASISKQHINAAMKPALYDLVEFEAESVALGAPLYNYDVVKIANTVCTYLNSKASQYKSIHLFAAIPAGLAVELGRRVLRSICYNIHTYQFEEQQYKHALVINPITAIKSDSVIDIDGFRQGTIPLPIVGKVACGDIAETINEAEDFFPYPSSLLGEGEYFILEAKGDSMVGAGICNGDFVLVRRQEYADDGQIVVARLDDDTTLKRLYRDDINKKIILHPENESYPNQLFDYVDIQGIAVKVIKNLI